MDLNVNELPERDPRREPKVQEPIVEPAPANAATTVKIAGFLAIVVVLTALAINSHDSSQMTMAPDTPPQTEGASTLPSATAPTDRSTTGAAPRTPGLAPNAPSETVPTFGTSR